jgi:hypothetical protein
VDLQAAVVCELVLRSNHPRYGTFVEALLQRISSRCGSASVRQLLLRFMDDIIAGTIADKCGSHLYVPHA